MLILSKLGVEGNVNLVKDINEESLIKIIIDKKQSLLKIRKMALQFSIELEIPDSAGTHEEDAKGMWIGKEDTKLSVCIDNTIIYIGNPKELT